jgi:hypothetical protein
MRRVGFSGYVLSTWWAGGVRKRKPTGVKMWSVRVYEQGNCDSRVAKIYADRRIG